jgi:hypothetical protein
VKRPILGVMWEWDHVRWLTPAEYEYWMQHPLPFGWAIISKPLWEEKS